MFSQKNIHACKLKQVDSYARAETGALHAVHYVLEEMMCVIISNK